MKRTSKYAPYVHEYHDNQGRPWYAVGQYHPSRGQYTRPLDSRERRRTGCSAEFARTPAGMQSYRTRAQALRRARTLFSDAIGDSYPDDLIEALETREAGLAGPLMTANQAWDQHLDQEVEAATSLGHVPGTVIARENRLRAAGNIYFEQGYRLHRTARQVRGLGFTIPDDAIEYRLESAGHIATTEAVRLVYVTRNA